MHLILAQKGAINQGGEAIDLGQTPADVVFLSAADTELASLAGALDAVGDCISLRLANLMQLAHPMSVDVYAQKTIAGSKLVVVRVLGGESYWPYGLETLWAKACQKGIQLAVLPGDDKPDPGLIRFCTIDAEKAALLHAYLNEGGPQNAANFLRYCAHLVGKGNVPPGPTPLLKAGIWYPGKGICSPAALDGIFLPEAPVAAISFYRALVQSGGLQPIEAMVNALRIQGINALPVFVSSLKDAVSVATLRSIFAHYAPDIVLNATGFAVGTPGAEFSPTVLEENGAMVLQVILSGGTQEAWQQSSQGLAIRDLAMNVALPEIDGRVLSRAIAFKHPGTHDERVQATIVSHRADEGRCVFVAELAAKWIGLRRLGNAHKRVGIVLANYPNRDGRIANGVGLDTPAGTIAVLNAMAVSGYTLANVPADGDALIAHLQQGVTNAGVAGRQIRETLSLDDYLAGFGNLPQSVRDAMLERWGSPQSDPAFVEAQDAFALSLAKFGNVLVGVQPARGYNIDPKQTYHSPDLVPPHSYLAFYLYLRKGADAIIHMGKHGNLEWLPGKALALSDSCFPEAMLGPMPHLYPFIVNDPGEGSQAKRRSSAVIIDHLMPPLSRAESHGGLKELEALVDEFYDASGLDPRRLKLLAAQIFERVELSGLGEDIGLKQGEGEEQRLQRLDAWLCDLKEMQIRDGLHVFGQAPAGQLATDLAAALVRVPRGAGAGGDASLQRAIAKDAGFGFDPLDCDMGSAWTGEKPAVLLAVSDENWRSNGDTVERIELLASKMVGGEIACPPHWENTQSVLAHVHEKVLPMLASCGEAELRGLIDGLNGRFVKPGPSGAPTRGRLDVLPTGRNFYSVDCRAVPTPAAWELGRKSAELLVARYRQDHGDWPKAFGLSVWGTSNMRTGGDDIAQAMALIGVKPVWEPQSRRVTGYEILPLAVLGRPRVDVTLRISGFFRDAFPAQIELYDLAVRAVGTLDEPERDNPVAARMRSEKIVLAASGMADDDALHAAGYRIFGSKPGAYGAGLQALIDEKGWENRGDLAQAYLAWGGYAYGARDEGREERQRFADRLSRIDAVVHNQDNREHDLLDSDDYYQFEGGMSAAAEHVSGKRPPVYHNDHSRPEKPVVRALEEEIARIVRGRAANPKWIAGVMRHGYKGAFEIAATLDYLFAFSATTGAVRSHHFDLVHDAWLADDKVRQFLAQHNPAALKEMAQRFIEAIERGLWTPRSNSAKFMLESLAGE